MRPAHVSLSPLSVLTSLALLGPLGLLAWQTSRGAPAPEPVEETFSPSPPPKPSAPPAVRSSLLVAKVKDPAVRPVGLGNEMLTDAPHETVEGTLTGTLAEIEEQLAKERAPRPTRVVRSHPRRPAAARSLPGCVKECRGERAACAGRRRGTANACRSAYTECVAACRASD
ncbi:hypothetical protein EPO15_02305 [bacterium]|nr:MAG: hypothetical protein EPO15_02305 [bacterium]